jgi:S1-C subfamily serine protease
VFDIKEVYEIDKRRDLALISIRGVDLPALKLARSSEVEVGHTVLRV